MNGIKISSCLIDQLIRINSQPSFWNEAKGEALLEKNWNKILKQLEKLESKGNTPRQEGGDLPSHYS